MQTTFSRVWQPALDYLVPALCCHCSQLVNSSFPFLCEDCYRRFLLEIREPWLIDSDRFALFEYGGVVRSLIHGLKYQSFSRIAGELIQKASFAGIPLPQSLQWVPVPVHPARKRERGYNQALLICKALQRRWGGQIWPDLLKRRKYQTSQTKLSREARQYNVRKAFKVHRPSPAEVILVDDVYTTGSTLQACAEVLLRSGAQRIRFLCLAWEIPASFEKDWVETLRLWGEPGRVG